MKFGEWLEYLFSANDKDYKPSGTYGAKTCGDRRSLAEYTNLVMDQQRVQEVVDDRPMEQSTRNADSKRETLTHQ